MDYRAVPLGELLRGLRVRAGLTQQQVADRSGLSVRALRYLERGSVGAPREGSLRALAEALGVAAADLAVGVPAPARPARSRFGVLGPFTVLHGGRDLRVGALKQRSLLALLALHPNRAVGRDEIIDVLWGERPPASCVGLVHTYASRLRRALAAAGRRNAGLIAATPSGYRLTVKPDQVDLLDFDTLVARARERREDDPGPPPTCSTRRWPGGAGRSWPTCPPGCASTRPRWRWPPAAGRPRSPTPTWPWTWAGPPRWWPRSGRSRTRSRCTRACTPG